MRTIFLKSGRFLLGVALVMPSMLLAAPPTQYEVQKLLASDGSEESWFGYDVVMTGDTAAISATNAAYVFTRGATGQWSEQTKLVPSDRAAWNWYVSVVAISNDTILIGASRDSRSGSAYVFVRNADGVWTEQAQLRASDGAPGDYFGRAVAISGDTAVIGAGREDPYGPTSGWAYVYARDADGSWSEQAKLVASDGNPQDEYGYAVAISGDTIMVGAYNDDDNGRSSGSAYVYTREAGGAWIERAKLLAGDGAVDSYFGASLAVSDDTALIGAFLDDDRGAAYVFTRDVGGAWVEQAKLTASDADFGTGFGSSLAISGANAVINGRSSAYVFTRTGDGAWSEQAKLLPSDEFVTSFGSSVSVDGDTAVVGAYHDGEYGGAAYVFDLAAAHTATALHCPGDVTGDGLAELVLVSGADVRVKDLAGTEINRFELTGMTGTVDSELMPDTNGNGAPELVALGGSPATAEVRDLLTGGDLGTVTFDAELAPFDLELVGDQTGNGIPELAALAEDPMRVGVRDGLTATAVGDVEFSRYSLGKDLLIYPDQNGNGAPELAVLADNRKPEFADKIEIRDTSTGAIVREIWLDRNWRVLEQELLGDQNGNGSPEVAVLRVHPAGNVEVQIRDTVTRARLKYVGFATKYPPQELVAIPDLDGNGADELVVFGRRSDGSDQKAVIKDSRTGQKLGELRFDRNFPGEDFVDCGDINANGATDLALVGRRGSDGAVKVIVKDSRTGERLALVQF